MISSDTHKGDSKWWFVIIISLDVYESSHMPKKVVLSIESSRESKIEGEKFIVDHINAG